MRRLGSLHFRHVTHCSNGLESSAWAQAWLVSLSPNSSVCALGVLQHLPAGGWISETPTPGYRVQGTTARSSWWEMADSTQIKLPPGELHMGPGPGKRTPYIEGKLQRGCMAPGELRMGPGRNMCKFHFG